MTTKVTIVSNKRKKIVKGLIEATDDALALEDAELAQKLGALANVEFANLQATVAAQVARIKAGNNTKKA